MNEVVVQNKYNNYPDIIQYDNINPVVRSPYATTDLYFYQTRETLQDIDTLRAFLKNAESRFRASREYKAYKSYLIEYLGIDRCQYFGNVTMEDLDDRGIGTIIHYPIPPHLSEAYEYLKLREGTLPITEKYAETVLSIPLYNGMTEEELTYVIKTINEWEGH